MGIIAHLIVKPIIASCLQTGYRTNELRRSVKIDVDKSASHQLSQGEIGSDNPCSRQLFWLKKWDQILFEKIRIFEPDYFLPKHSLTIVEHRRGQTFYAAELQFQLVGRHGQRIMHSDLASEPDRVLRVLHRVKLESDYNKALRPVLVEELLVARHLFLAARSQNHISALSLLKSRASARMPK